MIQDNDVFLDGQAPVREHALTQRLLSDYKEQKAFSYFASNFIMELLYHQISSDCKYCYLKAKARFAGKCSSMAPPPRQRRCPQHLSDHVC